MTAGAAGDDTDPTAPRWSARNQTYSPGDGGGEPPAQVIARYLRIRPKTEILSAIEEKWLCVPESKSGAQARVIAQLGMSVERQMGTVNSQIMLHQQSQHFIAFTCPGMAWIPEQAMMNDEQIDLGFHRHENRGKAAIDRRSQARHATSI